MATPTNSHTGLDANASGLITWSGENIDCLGICTGMNLNKVVYAVADTLCGLTAPLDLSGLTLQCALEVISGREEPSSRTIANVLQLMLDNDCKLNELITSLQNQIDGISNNDLTLNLNCLKQVDSFGNTLPYTEQSVIQLLLDNVCSLKDSVADLSGKYTTLKSQVDNLKIPSGNEVIVTTCLTTQKGVSVALTDLAKDYCAEKSIIGDVNKITSAIGKQSSIINTLMSSVVGWKVSPQTLADSESNQWLLLNFFATEIANLQGCCSGGCDNIKVGFIPSFDGNTVILQFTSGAGTKIPTGYTDCGSTLTISDSKGTTFSADIVIKQGGETDSIDLSSFTIGDILDFNIGMKLCSDTETCERCINKAVKYAYDGCCTITNTSDSDITIMYEVTVANNN